MPTESSLRTDPDVKMPAAVLAAAKKSAELQDQLRDPDANPDTGLESMIEAPAPEVTPQGNPDTTPPVTLQEPKPVETKPQEPTPPVADDDSWEHRYKSLHGRFVKQGDAIKSMGEEIQSLQQVIATMSMAPPPHDPARTAAPELSAKSLVTEEEVNEYGKDLLDVVGRRARQEIEPELTRRDAEIERLKAQLEGVNGFVQQDKRTKLMADMDSKLPSWRQINTDANFMNWLRLPDPYSGGIRHDMLMAAYAQGNANRVLAFFNGFLAEEAATAPAGQEPDPTTTKVEKVSLTSLAAPGRAKSAASVTPPAEKPIITRAQIAGFYADVAAGKYRNKEPEKAKLEKLIFDATKDGRVR